MAVKKLVLSSIRSNRVVFPDSVAKFHDLLSTLRNKLRTLAVPKLMPLWRMGGVLGGGGGGDRPAALI